VDSVNQYNYETDEGDAGGGCEDYLICKDKKKRG
jgi:hypothetical protein